MAGFEQHKAELAAVGATVIAASVDPLDKSSEVAAGLSFPVVYGVTRADADKLGSWWDDTRNFIQPSEFVLDASGKVVTSSYSSGPIARMEAADCVKMINFIEARKAAAAGKA